MGIAGGGAVLVFLGRTIADHVFSKDLERFRSDLKREADAEMEELRARLDRERYEHKARFGWLHEQEVESLAHVAEKLVDASGATRRAAQAALIVDSLGAEMRPLLAEALPKSVTTFAEADSAFRTRRIFMTDERAEEAISDFLEVLSPLQRQVEFLNVTISDRATPAMSKHVDTARAGVRERLPALEEAEEDLVSALRSCFTDRDRD